MTREPSAPAVELLRLTGGKAPQPVASRAARWLQLARTSYGVALVMAPGLVAYLATGRIPSRHWRRVAQLLGARHLAQAAVTALVPVPDVFALGAGADIAHAVSMVMLAGADRAARHAALADALAETVFAAAGFGCGRAAGTCAAVRPLGEG
jgi:hypothetical protein